MIYIAIAVAVFLLDFSIKKKIDQERELLQETPILKGKIILRKYYNKGAILDSLEKWPWLVKGICGSVLLVAGIFFACILREKGKAAVKLGLALILGGGASNFFDRLTKGHVVDYFSFKSRFKKVQRIIFNVSDLFIFLGTILMMLFHKKNR